MPSNSRSPSPTPRTPNKAKAESSSAPESPSPRKSSRGPRQQWTDEEEGIWREIVVQVLMQHLLPAIRADGRLDARKSSLTAHLKAYVKKL